MTFDIERLRREEFPWAAAGEAIYLNSASTGPLPQSTVRAVTHFTEMRANPGRISHEFQFGTLDRSRELLAKLLNASPREIALTTNTSFGINIAAWSLPLGKGDVVIGSRQEFPANVYPWMSAAKHRGFEFRMIREPAQDALLEAIGTPGVKAVAISWVEFSSGYRFDLEAIGEACRARGVFFVVDGIQGLGPLTIDVQRCHVDILSCGAQKWLLSPWGAGFTYFRNSLIPSLEPGFVSWMGVRGADDFSRLVDYDLTWRDDARRFEFVTLPFQEFAGLNASLELILRVGPANVASRTQQLASDILDWARARGVQSLTPAEPGRRAGIASLHFSDSAARSEKLQKAGVIHSRREGAIRLSPYFFNTSDEISEALRILTT